MTQGYHLVDTEKGLSLVFEEHPEWQPLRVDFEEASFLHRAQKAPHEKELIAKAIGVKKGQPLRVMDATAGLGKEAFLLATLGCDVLLFERNPFISALLKDGLTRAAHNRALASTIARMTLTETCAIKALENPHTLPPIDVIYCDPMFEPRTKSAAVKKGMQALQIVVGKNENDATQLVSLSLKVAKKRVVVKRPLTACPLHPNPSFEYKGKSHRYDVYLRA